MKIYLINICAAITLCLAALTSCNTDAEGTIYDINGEELAFASTQMNVEITAADNGIIRVPVYRGNTSTESTANISMDEATIAEDVFSLNTPAVTFAKGEAVGYVELGFGEINNLGATEKYEIVLTIDNEDQLSPSQLGKIKVLAQRKLTWESIGTGTYTSELFADSWPQPIEKAIEGNIYRLPSCIGEGYPFVFSLSDDKQELIAWDPQPTGYDTANYGMLYFAAAGMERQGNVLSFPMQGVVQFNGGWGVLYQDFTETLEMPEGF